LTILIKDQMDQGWVMWKNFFIFSLVLGAIAVLYQALMVDNDQPVEKKSLGFVKGFSLPLKEVTALMKENKEFRYFQLAFMMGGFGLMIIQPVIPMYFVGTLHIQPSDVMMAYGVCKAVGFVFTTPIWNRLLKRYSPTLCVLFVLIGFALFSLCLMYASISSLFIFIAYIIFGIAQGGSHLIWHLSGPIFSKDKSSSRFSAVNVVMVGVRGIIGPALGGMLLLVLEPKLIFALSMLLCMTGALFYLVVSRRATLENI
ncbi:MFS transporter, partial [bacterium]|nr:MFS transporter [bacterium]